MTGGMTAEKCPGTVHTTAAAGPLGAYYLCKARRQQQVLRHTPDAGATVQCTAAHADDFGQHTL